MDDDVLKRVRKDWDERARENALYHIVNSSKDWKNRDFYRSGEISVANDIMPKMHRICGESRSLLDLTTLEIGCGVGRMTGMLGRIFGHVTAVDVSKETIDHARANLADLANVTVILGDGATLSAVPDESHDFAFSFIVFQHIPSTEVIASYCREVRRVLRPGSLFKFQVNGVVRDRHGSTPDTWVGVSFADADAQHLCQQSGFQWEMSQGAGTQYFWLWFRKPQSS